MDAEWEKERNADDGEIDLTFDTFEALDQLTERTEVPKTGNPIRLYDHVAPFFVETAAVIRYLKGRMTMEVVYGELFAVLEKLHWRLYELFPLRYTIIEAE